MVPNAASGNPGRTHRYYAGPCVWAFGDGLSYSTFHLALAVATSSHVDVALAVVEAHAALATDRSVFRRGAKRARDTDIIVHVARYVLTNRGPLAGAHSVLAYVRPPGAGVAETPLRTLVDFLKLELQVGETREFDIEFTAHDLTLAKRNGGREARAGDWLLRVGDAQQITLRVA